MSLTKLEIKKSDEPYVLFSFYKNNEKVKDCPVCGMTLRKAGSMRFRWNEQNQNRTKVLSCIAETLSKNPADVTPVELIHSTIVYDVSKTKDTLFKTGDGIITTNPALIPVVTVADCVPIYLYDSVSKVFGIVHSGWKGTGIVEKAIKLAEEKYNSKAQDFLVIIGPHIRNCCYIVDSQRAAYFTSNFSSECVKPLEEGGSCFCGGRGLAVNWNNGSGQLYRLSLEAANLAVLKKAGVLEENIAIYEDCTCCNEIFGSNRRETANSQQFTVQAAFITGR